MGTRIAGFALAALLALPAAADDGIGQQAEPTRERRLFAGSDVSYGHVVAGRSLQKDYELSYDPYYAHALTLAPRLALGGELSLRGRLSLEQELTNSNWTTEKHELLFSDLFLDLGWRGWKEPRSGIRVSGGLRANLPLSKASQAQTLIVGLSPSVRLSRTFDVLEGLTLGYGGRFTGRFHAETTARYDAPTIQGCGEPESCGRLLNTGVRNSDWELAHGPQLSFSPMEKLDLSTSLTLYASHLYAPSDEAVRVDTGTAVPRPGVDPVRFRYATSFDVGATYALIDELDLGVRVGTVAPQLAPDGSRRDPLFNRYTTVSFDLSLHVDRIAAQL